MTSAPHQDVSNSVPPERLDFFNLDMDELAQVLEDRFGAPSYRATQLFQWVYKQGVRDFSKMTNLGASLREGFTETFSFPEATQRERLISQDGTRKYLFALESSDSVESVMIKQPTRMTLCVSSQVGCGMGCSFCRTATMGFQRNLSTSEIVRQVLAVKADAINFNDSFSNIVFMGMGEPLHNFKNVTRAFKILLNQNGLEIPGRKITVSSVGLVPAIKKFGETGIDVNLAISLNATTDEVRSRIMPVNRRFSIAVLLDTLRSFPLKRRRKITIEYVMLAGVNDTDADLMRLPRLLHGIPCKLNLIPYNENAGLGFKSPQRAKVAAWQDRLLRAGLDTTVRWSKGADIKAACGQLAVERQLEQQMIAESALRVIDSSLSLQN